MSENELKLMCSLLELNIEIIELSEKGVVKFIKNGEVCIYTIGHFRERFFKN